MLLEPLLVPFTCLDFRLQTSRLHVDHGRDSLRLVDATLVAAMDCMAPEVVLLCAGLTLGVFLKGTAHCDRGVVTVVTEDKYL